MGGGSPERTDDPSIPEAERRGMAMKYKVTISDESENEENADSDREMVEATAGQIRRLETVTNSNISNGSPINSPYSTPGPLGELNSHGTGGFNSYGTGKFNSHEIGHETGEFNSHEIGKFNSHGTREFNSRGTGEFNSHEISREIGEFNSHESSKFNSHGTDEFNSHEIGHETRVFNSRGTGEFDSHEIGHETREFNSHESSKFNSHGTGEFTSHEIDHETREFNDYEIDKYNSHGANEFNHHGTNEFNHHGTGELSLAAPQTQYPRIQDTTFEANLSYEQSIRKREAEKNPFVGRLEGIEELMREYEHGSESYRQKIQKLAEKHGKIRRCRGDGNCFYRALAFAWFERLLHSRSSHLIQKAIETIKSTSDLLASASFQPEVIEDFYEGVYQLLQSIAKGNVNDESLWDAFQVDMTSNLIVWYFRAVTSAFLKKNREEFEPFLEVEMDMNQYCAKFVEVMDKEADHIHVTVLTRALRVPVEIAYLSGSDALEEVNFHEFYPESEENNGVPTVPLKPLVLLYRPGHYDILYRNE